jgi:hypothetical protein
VSRRRGSAKSCWSFAARTGTSIAALLASGAAGRLPGAEVADVSPFGFRALEIYKVESTGARGLQVVDLDLDGAKDLVVANNDDGSIRLFYQRDAGKAEKDDALSPDAAATSPGEGQARVNDVPSDRRFRVEKFYTDKMVTSLAVGDFDGDGKPDLAYYSDPKELEVVFQDASWGARREKYPIRDGSQSPHALRAGHLDGDGKLDLVLLGDDETYLLYQRASGGLAQPIVLNNSQGEAGAVELADVDGDGRLDLLYFKPSNEEPVLVRRQGPSGFGPEVASPLQAIQAWVIGGFGARCVPAATPPSAAAPEERASPLLFVLQANTRRLKGFRWQSEPTSSGLTPAHIVAHRREGDVKAMRRLLADVDGDGRVDLVTSYPDTAQLEVTFQTADGWLARRVTYPTLAGVNGLAVMDVDGDGTSEVLVSSAKEKAIGASRWEDGRLRFPQTWALAGDPLLVAAAPSWRPPPGGDPAPDGARERAFVITRAKESRFDLRILKLLPDGAVEEEAAVAVESEGSEPASLELLDIDGDGGTDALVFVPYQDPAVYRRRPPESKKEPSEPDFENLSKGADFGRGQLAKAAASAVRVLPAGALSPADGRRAGLLVAAGSFARSLELDPRGRLRVVDQYSGRTSSAKIASAALLDVDGDGTQEVALVDTSTRSLDILVRRPDGGYELGSNVKLPKLDLVRLETRDMDGDGRSDVVLFGEGETAILYARKTQEGFVEVLSHAIEKDDLGRPQDVGLGDFNGDGRPDLILATAPYYNLVFLCDREGTDKKLELEKRCAFPIFEEKSYMRRSQTLGPQQMVAADIDRDDLEDLVILIHDRILLYLQDASH